MGAGFVHIQWRARALHALPVLRVRAAYLHWPGPIGSAVAARALVPERAPWAPPCRCARAAATSSRSLRRRPVAASRCTAIPATESFRPDPLHSSRDRCCAAPRCFRMPAYRRRWRAWVPAGEPRSASRRRPGERTPRWGRHKFEFVRGRRGATGARELARIHKASDCRMGLVTGVVRV